MAVDVENFYRKYGPMVMRRCRFLLKNEEEALDAMQEVFVQVLRRKDILVDSAPSSLLYTIATNICLNAIRKRKRAAECLNDEILSSIAGRDDPEGKVVHSHFLKQLFNSANELDKHIAVLYHVDGLTLEQTAAQVGLSISGVRKKLMAFRKRGLELQEV